MKIVNIGEWGAKNRCTVHIFDTSLIGTLDDPIVCGRISNATIHLHDISDRISGVNLYLDKTSDGQFLMQFVLRMQFDISNKRQEDEKKDSMRLDGGNMMHETFFGALVEALRSVKDQVHGGGFGKKYKKNHSFRIDGKNVQVNLLSDQEENLKGFMDQNKQLLQNSAKNCLSNLQDPVCVQYKIEIYNGKYSVRMMAGYRDDEKHYREKWGEVQTSPYLLHVLDAAETDVWLEIPSIYKNEKELEEELVH